MKPEVCAISTVAVPAPKLQALLERWRQHSQHWEADVEYHKRPIFKDDPSAAGRSESCQARVSIYTVCINDLSEELASVPAEPTVEEAKPWFTIRNGWLVTRENQRFQLSYVRSYSRASAQVRLDYGATNCFELNPCDEPGKSYASGAEALIAALDEFFAGKSDNGATTHGTSTDQ